jgi:DNA-binding transcriptional LysR family regulator
MTEHPGMELRHLRYFAALAVEGSFNRAAAKLHLTQPTLSRQVKDLEEELGVALVRRGANAVTLTPAGEVFYTETLDVLARAEQAVRRIRERGKAGSLRVGFNPSLTAGVMPRVIERFHAVEPKVRLELADLAPGEMVAEAQARRIDILITPTGIESDLEEFAWEILRKLAPVLVLSPRHPLARLKKIPPSSLRRVTLLGLDRKDYPEYATRMRTLFRPFGFVPQFEPEGADGINTLFAQLEAESGAAILTESVGAMLPRALVLRPFSAKLAPIIIKVGWLADRLAPQAETFVRLLREETARVSSARLAGEQ